MEIRSILEVAPLKSYYKVMDCFKRAFEELSIQISGPAIESLAHTVVDSMSGAYRLYHRTDHILDLAEGMDPLGTLAALYHDIVYVQVDGGVPVAVQSMVLKYVSMINGVLYTTDVEGDPLYDIALTIFAFEKGQKLLPQSGQNEFLSALVAMAELKALLSLKQLVAITCCIEATIPFRGKKNPMENLKDRTDSLSIKLHLSLSKQEHISMIQRAALIANKDVENFAYENPRDFLNNTWKLLPENNLRLGESAYFSTREYRIALQKMLGFLTSLDNKAIYYQYESIPSDEHMQKIFSQAAKNLKTGQKYLKVELYVTFMLEALAQLSGGDIPLVYMIGSVNEPSSDSSVVLMRHFLPKGIPSIGSDQDSVVIDLFENEKTSDMISLDKEMCEISLFVYRILGEAKVESFHESFKQFIDGSLSYKDVLDKQPPQLIKALAFACSKVAKMRQKELASF